MSHSFSPPRKVLGTPNEIDHVDFYLSSGVPSMMKSSTSLPVKVTETSCPTLSSPFELNNPAPPSQSGPHLLMLSDCLFEGDLPEHRHSESNFLAASENMVIESLTQMREGLINDEGSGFGEVSLESTEPIFDKTPEVGLSLASDSDNTDEVNTLLRRVVQKRMVPVTAKEKEKVIEETPKRKPFTRATNKKFMGDAMKSNKATTKENRRRFWRLIYMEKDWWWSKMNTQRMILNQNIFHWLRNKGEGRNKKRKKGREYVESLDISLYKGLLLQKGRRLRKQLRRRRRQSQKKRWRLCLLLRMHQNRDLVPRESEIERRTPSKILLIICMYRRS
ncbi:hypothetical protein KY290_001342 [Solanum tuberosum]|uniref:Uncharacterized protein n=1 Tax=Solanum tuberosum TaxID=4113 RepID=A0ABQ7WM25_SOLTU|nr:hypothetical protein KY290_001342 [Solanum tuberosum]